MPRTGSILFTHAENRLQPRVLADVVSDDGAAWLAFSPDGGRIAYVLQGSLHTNDL